MQPVALATAQVEPVKPFMQMQAQFPLLRKVLPPFWQDVTGSVWHCWRGVRVAAAGAALGLLRTRSSRGTTTAAAMMIKRIRRTRKNPQHGSPQQRRPFFFNFSSWRPAEDGSPSQPGLGDGQESAGCGVRPSLGVASPGGGKAASMPERPDWRFSSGETTNVRLEDNIEYERTYDPSPCPYQAHYH